MATMKWMDDLSRGDLVYMAKLAEQAERYNDMCECMVRVVKKDSTLNVEERNLLSVAYKNVIGAHRASWRIISSIEAKTVRSPGEETKVKTDMVKDFRQKIEVELDKTCNQILEHITNDLIPANKSDEESTVFYHKMSGDYQRYLAEFKVGDAKQKATDASQEAYKAATEAAKGLPSTHPIRLGLALNFSVYYYEIMNMPQEACKLAKEAFDEAISELDNLPEESYKDSTLIMQLLRDNLTLWTSETDNADEGENQNEN